MPKSEKNTTFHLKWTRTNLNRRRLLTFIGIFNNLAAGKVNQGWSLDFLSDDVVAENKARILNVMDEFSRKCLLVDAKKVYKAKQLVTALENLVATYVSLNISDAIMGSELVSKKMAKFCKKQGIEIWFTQPGKPMQNGLVESLNETIRTECLNLKVFTTINQIQAELDECGTTCAVANL